MGELMAGALKLAPQALASVSPSQVTELEACHLHVALQADRHYRTWPLTGAKARIGSVCHRVLEQAVTGSVAALPQKLWRESLEEFWRSEISKEERLAAAAPLSVHLGPATRSPGYALQKARVMRKAMSLLEWPSNILHAARYEEERWYRAYGGRLRGRADVVRVGDGQVELADYKTGAIFEDSEDGGSPVLKMQYRRQLLLYAAMHHDETGEWPAMVYVVPLAGEKVGVEVLPVEAEAEAARALALLEAYNADVARAAVAEDLASPSAEACRNCGFQAICEPFWGDISPAWDWGHTASVCGMLTSLRHPADGEQLLEVAIEAGNTGHGTHSVRAYRRIGAREGERVACIRLAGWVGGQQPLTVADYSELWPEAMLKAAQEGHDATEYTSHVELA